jgi:hypothetical protein
MDKRTLLEEKRKKGIQTWLGDQSNERAERGGRVTSREGKKVTSGTSKTATSSRQISNLSENDLQLLTGKITASIREEMKRDSGNTDLRRALSEKMDRYLESELHTHTCKLCSALMVSPDHTPMLLFPCGHR